MPRVFCPNCLRGNNFKATKEYACCEGCNINLYDHFIRDKSKNETDLLITEARRLREKRDEDERTKKLEEEREQKRIWAENRRKEFRFKLIKIGITSLFLVISIGFIWNEANEFFSDEAVAQRVKANQERELERERLKEERLAANKKEFELSLGSSIADVSFLDLQYLADVHVSETEIQNDATEKKLVNNYFKMTGQLFEIDSKNKERYGYNSYMIQIWEPDLFVTAICWVKSKSDIDKISSARRGQRFSIVGRVRMYGDNVGLQMDKCSIL